MHVEVLYLKKMYLRIKNLPEVKSTIAFMHEYSALSTWRTFNFSTCSWKIRMWSIKDTTRSAAIGAPWRPAATRRGATFKGILHCAALSTNNSDQTSRSKATWSVTWSSGNPGIFLVHSTALNSSLAANSHMLSIPIMLLDAICIWPYREVVYGSALNNMEM